LRETRRMNRDGSVVSYLQLAPNERHPVSGNPGGKVIHNFGQADKVDRVALARIWERLGTGRRSTGSPRADGWTARRSSG
jgi:hypothetical protein